MMPLRFYLTVILLFKYIIVNSNAFIVHKFRGSRSGLFSSDSLEEVVSKTEKVYIGPISSFDKMKAGCEIEDLGLQIMVGNSIVSTGLGFYIALSDDVDEVTLPRGTPICGYSRGRFTSESEGDKTVAYSFRDVNNGILFQGDLMPIFEAIGKVTEKSDNLTYVVQGHLLLYDDVNNGIIIKPDPQYTGGNYFIPDATFEWGPGYFGMFANDMAYHGLNTSMEEYIRNSISSNILQIVWRMDAINEQLVPKWPVVVFNTDIKFTNKEPMECGMHYSWRYWEAYRLNSYMIGDIRDPSSVADNSSL